MPAPPAPPALPALQAHPEFGAPPTPPHGPAPPSETRRAMRELNRRHRGARVLVADDDPINQEVARAMLEAAGIDVTVVGDGEAAVTSVMNAPPDLVLMDMQMPGTDGLLATRRLREAGARLPIVALTASAFDADRERCLDAGMDAFLSKPFEPSLLYRSLLELLGTQEPGPHAPHAADAAPNGLPPRGDDAVLRPLLERLAVLLAQGDADAREFVLEHRAQLAGSGDGERLVTLVLDFDLEPALEVARRMHESRQGGPAAIHATLATARTESGEVVIASGA